jgi:CheY-like chemotaxis protein
MKVLVVDDNATSRGILQEMLKSFSFEVSVAASAKEGITELEDAHVENPFELVIMDWKMPGMDGIEASKQIKRHTGLSKIPAIVLVTAYGREEVMQQAEQMELEGFLLKPVSASMLFDTIMQAFGEAVSETSRLVLRKEQETEALKNIEGAHVLLVEDNEINQQVAREILEGAGLIVALATNGQEAVDAVKETNYDAVLMDVQMPVMDGYTATRAIRKWESVSAKADADISKTRNVVGENTELKSEIESMPSVLSPQNSELDSQATSRQHPKSSIQYPESSIQHPVPIIAMTAHAMAGDEQKSIDAGMNDHVTKPIDPDQLFTTLQKWIKPAAERAAVQQPPVLGAPAEPDQALPHKDELPDSLPGFDLQAGLARLMGNKRLYRKLLLDFGVNYREIAGEIREALAAKDFKQAHSLVHNLKGLAGNLDAKDLQAAAVEMEKLVRGQTAKATSDKELNRKFTELENALEQALDAVQTLGPTAEKKTHVNTNDARTAVPAELIKKVTEGINAAVELGDIMKIQSIAEALKSESEAMTPFCDKIIQLADDFDFDGIQKLTLEFES